MMKLVAVILALAACTQAAPGYIGGYSAPIAVAAPVAVAHAPVASYASYAPVAVAHAPVATSYANQVQISKTALVSAPVVAAPVYKTVVAAPVVAAPVYKTVVAAPVYKSVAAPALIPHGGLSYGGLSHY